MRTVLIVNPCAGCRSGLPASAAAEGVFREAGWEVSRRLTERSGDGERLAREALAESPDLVFACGGDGTLSQVLTGLLDSGVPTGIIPAGTGNDFGRALGIACNPAAAARQALVGRARPMDLLEINGGECWAFNVTGTGFDAAVAERINRRRRLTGGLTAYLSAVLQELAVYRATEVRLQVDGEEWEGRALLVAVANAQAYGAGMRIAPRAQIDDGQLDVVLVKDLSRARFVWSLPRVFRGTHLSHPAVWTWRAREVTVETARPAPVLVDGDVRVRTPLRVRVLPGRGLLWTPEAESALFGADAVGASR